MAQVNSAASPILDTRIIDAIKVEIDKMMGADIPVKSFVSEKQ